MTDLGTIQLRAKKRAASIARRRRSDRYRRVLGRYVSAGLLTTNYDVELNRDPMAIKDVLWAGEIEPRLLELLPAIVVKRPSLLTDAGDLPRDLAQVVASLRKNETPDDFRGIPGADLQRWLPRVGHKDKLPSRLKSFRLQHDDTLLLSDLQDKLGISQTEVLRRALRSLAASTLGS